VVVVLVVIVVVVVVVIVVSPVCLLESSFLLKSEFQESELFSDV
jgi:hypothetical protein